MALIFHKSLIILCFYTLWKILLSRTQVILVKTKPALRKLHEALALAFNKPLSIPSDEELEHMLQEYQQEKPRAIRVIAVEDQDSEALGSGGMSLFDDLGVATFFGGGTIPSARKRGVYSALIDARIKYAQERGIAIIGIYARHGTSAPIVEQQGFLKCGEMHAWVRKA